MNSTDDLDDLHGYQIIHQSVAGILREKRVVLGMTQKQVAEKAKIPLQSYQRFERGERNLKTASFVMACRVIEVLGMDISKFYHNEYTLGEEIYLTKEGIRFVKTGRLCSEDITDDVK